MKIEKEHKLKTLMNYTKRELAEHCMTLEHNNNTLRETIDQQYANSQKIIKDMEIAKLTYRESKKY